MDIQAVSSVVGDTSAGAAKKTETGSGSADFSEVLSEALKNDVAQEAALAASGLGTEMSASQILSNSVGDDIMTQITEASETGSLGQAEIALLMLCMMMQSMGGGDGGSELSMMLMSAMSSLFQSLGKDASDTAREKIMTDESISPEVLDKVDKNVFGNDYAEYYSDPNKSQTGESIIPAEAWRPTSPAITSGENDRSVERLNAVIDQFGVESSERYRPYRRGGDTYCNIFVWDVTSAMGAEIPHFVDINTGEPRQWPDISGAYELDANGMQLWLDQHGAKYGWREASAEEAQAWANEGKPAITSWNNVGGIGHVQMVRPSEDGSFDPVNGPTVAQAGASRYNYGYASQSFGPSRMPQVRYYIHD